MVPDRSRFQTTHGISLVFFTSPAHIILLGPEPFSGPNPSHPLCNSIKRPESSLKPVYTSVHHSNKWHLHLQAVQYLSYPAFLASRLASKAAPTSIFYESDTVIASPSEPSSTTSSANLTGNTQMSSLLRENEGLPFGLDLYFLQLRWRRKEVLWC
ncbi:hypothetical protein DPMN_064817 [Dreissena polymorpha]|uniref:Uncharacterized protein n=1 Tax=Dreissena polymorpha TaxID=45954 RepID=A0A9D4CCX7_DREPO|nr:hypothetical protein DPMN_064817 [Dreissena polymorpha]